MNTTPDDIQQQLDFAERKIAMYTSIAGVLRKQKEAQLDMEDLRATYPEMETEWPPFKPDRDASLGRSKVRVYEEVLREQGRPLHVSELLPLVKAKGVTFDGVSPEQQQLRNSLHSASNRFQNVGSNTWWLVDEPAPGRTGFSTASDGVVQDEILLSPEELGSKN